MKHTFWITLLSVAITCSAAAGGTGGALQRWAVLCSKELQDTALNDLVAVELSKAMDLELVNREELSRVESELELAQLFDAASAEDRLKLGRMVRADALVLIRRHGAYPKAPLLLTIAECNQGARLHSQELPTQPDAAAASQIAKIVLATRRHFSRGVTQLLAVPDFLSRNLTHDYDQFQGRYANLLREAISLDEGVAVLEIEEAHAISKELTGEELGIRHVPLVIEGEFRMDVAPGSTPPTVSLHIRLIDDNSSRTIESPKLAIAKVPQWIASDLARQVLVHVGGKQSLTIEAQIRLLIARADEFAQLGDYPQSVNLREAVLLIDPSLIEQRLKLLEACMTVIQSHDFLTWSKRQLDRSTTREQIRQKVDLYLQALEHLEYVIRNRQVERDRAVGWTFRLNQAFGSLKHPVLRQPESHGDRIGREELARAQEPKRRFYLEVVPKILDMPPLSSRPEHPLRFKRPQNPLADKDFIESWQSTLLAGVADRTDRKYPMPSDLKDLVHAYTKILPDGLPLSLRGSSPRPYEIESGGATPKDYMTFYRKLAESDHKTASIRGRYMLLLCQYDKARGKRESGMGLLIDNPFEKTKMTPEKQKDLLDQVQKLKADYRALPRLANLPSPEHDDGWHDITDLEQEIENSLRPERQQRMWANDPTQHVSRSTGALHFKPIPLVIRQLDGTIEQHPDARKTRIPPQRIHHMNVVRCGPTTDVFWCREGVFVMRRPGSMDEVLHAKLSRTDLSQAIQQVVWDGRQLWVSKRNGAVWIVSIDGAVLAKVDASSGLPPASPHGAVLHPLENGRVVALGSFGDPPRAWAATITYAGDKAAVHIFFEAKNAPPLGPQLSGRDAIDVGFRIGQGSVHAYQPRGVTGRPLLLVQRSCAFPLQINLETFAVSIFRFHDARNATHETYWYSRDGVLLEGSSSRIGVRAPQGQPWPNGKLWRPIPLSNPPAPNPDYDDMKPPQMLRYLFDNGIHPSVIDCEDGYVYYFGQFCYRINPSTWTADRLTSTLLPGSFEHCLNFGISAHYGMTAWAEGTFYQISLDEKAIPPAGGPMAK
ncbi:MAG: hypothetical protein ABFC77_00290 [Thermoguttaceae bacterium]